MVENQVKAVLVISVVKIGREEPGVRIDHAYYAQEEAVLRYRQSAEGASRR